MFLKLLEYWARIFDRVTYPAEWVINSASPGYSDPEAPETPTNTPDGGKSIDRYGQQEDGTWVIKEYRDSPNSEREKRMKYYTPQGKRMSPEESPWQGEEKLSFFGRFRTQVKQPVFCPMQPPENPNAIRELVRAVWECRGRNFMPTIFTLGWVVGGLQVWHKEQQTGDKSYPILNIWGEGSRVAYDLALSLIGSDWNSLSGSISRLNYRSLRKLAKQADLLGSLVVAIEQPRTYRSILPEKFQEIIAGWYRREAVSIRDECINVRSSLLILSRSPYCDYEGNDHLELDRHILVCPFTSEPIDSRIIPGPLFTQASASFFRLIALGWQGDKIAEFERSLCDRLNVTPETILSMGKLSDLAIVGCYAQILLEMAQIEESMLEWLVRENKPQICDDRPLALDTQ